MEAIGVATVRPVAAVCSSSSEEPASRLARLFDRTCEGLYRFILVRVGGDRHVADDLIQQTCQVAAGNRRLPEDDGDGEAWLRGVARNLIRKHWRRRRLSPKQVRLEDVGASAALAAVMESGSVPAEDLVREEAVSRLLLAITELPQAEQGLLFEFYFDGRSMSRMADDRGVSVKSVESKLYRIRGRLRARLRGAEGIGE